MKSVIKLLVMSSLTCAIPMAPTQAFFAKAPVQSFWTWRTVSALVGLSALGAYGFYHWYTQKPVTLPLPKALSIPRNLAQTPRPAFWRGWSTQCYQQPYFKEIPRNFVHKQSVTPEEFERTLDEFSTMMATKTQLRNHDAWLKGNRAANNAFFDLSQDNASDLYVQKYECNPNSTFIIHGDLHGDIHSLIHTLMDHIEPSSRGFHLNPNRSLIFLGDYVDKGFYGCECMYTLMRLKIDNPDRVFLIRGNHETKAISSAYGFKDELRLKGFDQALIDKTFRVYNLLPVALYLGSGDSFIQCCHGGIEIGFDAGPLLNAPAGQQFQWVNSESCKRKKIADQLNISHCCAHHVRSNPSNESESGFMWSDFIVDPQEQTFYREGRGLNFGFTTTQNFLAITNHHSHGSKKLRGIFRAHQHSPELNPMMTLILDYYNQDPDNKGIAKLWKNAPKKGNRLWNGIVITFNVSPGTPYGKRYGGLLGGVFRWIWPGFDFDTIGMLKINGPFEQWTLDIYRNHIG